MQDRPSTLELLRIAHQTLLEAILPELEGEPRLEARMLGNALAMVVRAMETGDGALRAEHERLQQLLGESPRDGETSGERVRSLNRTLVARIRAGVYDDSGPAREEMRRHLLEATAAKLRESNPRALEAEGLK